MGQAADLRGVAVQPEIVVDLLIRLVHHYHRYLSVGIDEGGGQQRTSAGRGGDSPRARSDKLREVSDVVIRVRVNQLARFRIGVDRGEAEISDVIRPALF